MTETASETGGLPKLPPWPVDNGWSDLSEYRFDMIAALRARLELAVSTLEEMHSDESAQPYISPKDASYLRQIGEVIAACKEPT